LEELRHAAGDPSFKILERRLVQAVGLSAPSGEKIRLYHKGDGPDPELMDIDLLVELAIIYGVALDDLSSVVADRARARAERLALLPTSNREPGVTVTRRQRQPIAA
jgi:hypothetical protein